MKTKTKVVRFRVSEEEHRLMMEEFKKDPYYDGNLSYWIIKNLTRYHPDVVSEVCKAKVNEEGIIIGAEKGHSCASPSCPSIQTKSYQRATGTFWLCDTHKP